MKTLVKVGLILVLFAILSACSGSDGYGYLVVPYGFGDNTDTIRAVLVKDDYDNNGIFLDTESFSIYCNKGPDNVVFLPDSTVKENRGSTYVEIRVEAVCEMGQDNFDQLLVLITTSPPK